jgi:hypothetical protein
LQLTTLTLVSQNFYQEVALVIMDIISQLQEQVNSIANLALNTIGTLQRDAPPNRLSPNYPEPPAHPTEDGANFSEEPKLMSASLVKAAKQVCIILVRNKKEPIGRCLECF